MLQYVSCNVKHTFIIIYILPADVQYPGVQSVKCVQFIFFHWDEWVITLQLW